MRKMPAPRKDHRNFHRCVVYKKSVIGFTMLIQAFTMITHHNNQRVLHKARLFQLAEKSAQNVIGVGNFTIIGSRSVLCLERFGWIIRSMGIIQVDPEKEWFA